MAQFVHQYVEALVPAEAAAAQMLGVNIYGVPRETWIMFLTLNTAIGVVMKALSDANPAIFTDAAWLNALNHALDQSASSPWAAALLNQVDPTQPPAVG